MRQGCRVLYFIGGGVTAGAAGIADHHGIVSLPNALRGNFQPFFGPIGGVVLVQAIQGEIAFLLRPLPVIFVPAKSGDADRRRRHQAKVRVFPIEHHIVFLARPHGVQRGLQARLLLVAFFHDERQLSASDGLSLREHFLFQGGHLIGDVQHLLQEKDLLSGNRELFCARHSPETFLQIVMFGRAERVDIAKGAMVVGNEQAVRGHHAARAIESQGDDGIREGCAGRIGIVNVFCVQQQAAFLHFFLQSRIQGVDQPHPFIGAARDGRQQQHQGKEQPCRVESSTHLHSSFPESPKPHHGRQPPPPSIYRNSPGVSSWPAFSWNAPCAGNSRRGPGPSHCRQ